MLHACAFERGEKKGKERQITRSHGMPAWTRMEQKEQKKWGREKQLHDFNSLCPVYL